MARARPTKEFLLQDADERLPYEFVACAGRLYGVARASCLWELDPATGRTEAFSLPEGNHTAFCGTPVACGGKLCFPTDESGLCLFEPERRTMQCLTTGLCECLGQGVELKGKAYFPSALSAPTVLFVLDPASNAVETISFAGWTIEGVGEDLKTVACQWIRAVGEKIYMCSGGASLLELDPSSKSAKFMQLRLSSPDRAMLLGPAAPVSHCGRLVSIRNGGTPVELDMTTCQGHALTKSLKSSILFEEVSRLLSAFGRLWLAAENRNLLLAIDAASGTLQKIELMATFEGGSVTCALGSHVYILSKCRRKLWQLPCTSWLADQASPQRQNKRRREPAEAVAEAEALQSDADSAAAALPRLQQEAKRALSALEEAQAAARVKEKKARRAWETARALEWKEKEEKAAETQRQTAWELISHLPDSVHSRAGRRTSLPVSDPRYSLLRDLVMETCVGHRKNRASQDFCAAPILHVLGVTLVSNPELTEGYLQVCKRLQLRWQRFLALFCKSVPQFSHLLLKDEDSQRQLNEVLLFHGAPERVVEEICANGFDPRRGGESAGKMFGVGSYFATNASKADQYTEEFSRPLARGMERRLIVARVVMGQTHRTLTAMPQNTRPPNFSLDDQPLDSVWADVRANGGAVDHPEVVVYEKGQALPIALVTYKHAAACACAACLRRPK